MIPAESDTEPDIRWIHLSGDPRQLLPSKEESKSDSVYTENMFSDFMSL